MSAEPRLPPDLVERVLARLGLARRPAPDLAGLNGLYAAWSAAMPFDNAQKRVWLAGGAGAEFPGAAPAGFFEAWLAHGTGGTCWAVSGALLSLLAALGFRARPVSGRMVVGQVEEEPDSHGSLVVTLDGRDYLTDGAFQGFEPLALAADAPSRTRPGLHAMSARPTAAGFEVSWYPGHRRDAPFLYRAGREAVDHAFFRARLDHYLGAGPFKDWLYICVRRPRSILTLRRGRRYAVAGDGAVSVREMTPCERPAALVDEFGLSEEIAAAIPADAPA